MNKKDIQGSYKKHFDIIDSFFGSIKHYLGEKEDSHYAQSLDLLLGKLKF